MAEELKVDRNKTTPFLLRLYYRVGSFHRLEDFSPQGNSHLKDLQIYTWPDCSLRELTKLITDAVPDLLPSPSIGSRVAFRLIFADTRSERPGMARYMHKELGSVVMGDGGPGLDVPSDAEVDMSGDADKTLQDARFVIGDYISCAVLPPLSDGRAPAPPPPSSSMGRSYGGPPPRENGFGGAPYGGYGGHRRGGRYGGGGGGDFGGGGGGVPSGPWIRGDVPGGPGRGGYGRGRGRGRW